MTRRGRELRTGGAAWGQRRVRVGMSLRQLEERSGISRGLLSLAEHGRLVPTADEFDKVMAVLEKEGAHPPAESGTVTKPEP